jgi:hypothetical protein
MCLRKMAVADIKNTNYYENEILKNMKFQQPPMLLLPLPSHFSEQFFPLSGRKFSDLID